ncbi:hypothetical protein IAU60_003190 [Kwoniella sp. DSM 27419]
MPPSRKGSVAGSAAKAIPTKQEDMSSSPSVARSLARNGGVSPGQGQGAASPPIPNIPPRSNSISVQAGGRSLGTSYQAKSPLSSHLPTPVPRSSAGSPGVPHKASSDTLGRKTSPARKGEQSSALTAALDSTPDEPSFSEEARPSLSRQPSSGSNVNLRPGFSRDHSGTSTPRRDEAGESTFSNLADVTNEEKAKVLRRHLGSTTPHDAVDEDRAGESSVSGYGSTGVQQRNDVEQFPIPYDAVGGDVTHDLYKWQHEHRPHQPVRSASFSHIPLDRSAILDPTLAHIKEPGGFRRNFVSTRAQEQGLEAPTMVRNVVDFLFLYGHFAGEDLNEDDDVDDEDEESSPAASGAYARRGYTAEDEAGPSTSERAPLLRNTTRGLSMTRHRRTKSGPSGGTASTTQAVLMVGFVGTGILFMGKAFFNGGILFSAIVMVGIAAISLWSFLLLVKAYLKVPGSFGDIGGALYGNYMRLTILFSITVSQIGFVAAFVLAVTNCKTFIPVRWMIFAQLIVFLPLAMIRNLAKLSGTALVADAFILIGSIADVQLFNRDSFPLLIGTAVFAFEGIGLLLSIVMFFVAILFAGAGVMSYATYGSDIQTVVIVNLPQEDKFVQAVQFLSVPRGANHGERPVLSIRQAQPVGQVAEEPVQGLHRHLCSLLSWAGSKELDKFVSLIGSFAWWVTGTVASLTGSIPLCFIYPPMLHLKACARTRTERTLDILLIIFGVLVGVYTTVQTIRSLAQPSPEPPTGRCGKHDDY